MKKLLTFFVAISLFLGIGTAALAHSNNTPSQGNGNWQQLMDYCSEMMNSFMNNHQNNIQHETTTSKDLNTGQINSNGNTTNNHQNQNQSMFDDCC